MAGICILLIMYWFRNDKTAQAIIGSCWLYYEWKACFAFLSINMYNGERGFVKGKFLKYVFYLVLSGAHYHSGNPEKTFYFICNIRYNKYLLYQTDIKI